MGQIFSQLTQPNSALINPNGSVAQMGNPSQMRDMDFKASSAQHPYLPGTTNPNAPVATAQTPTLQQAQSYGAGPVGANALSPGLTKAGKLATLLQSGLQGALAGRAASEQTVAQTGGRRSGGAGMGFEAAEAYPWQQAGRAQQLQQQQAQTALTRAQSDMVQTPYGMMPASIARYILPASIRGAATEGAAQTRAGAQVQGAQIGAKAKTDVANIEQGMRIPVDETVANLAGIPELAGQSVGKGTWDNINKSLSAKGYHTQDMGKNGTDENSGMWLMDKGGNRIKQVSPNSLTFQRGASFAQNRPEEYANPDNPGEVRYTTAANAMANNLLAPASAATQGARSEARSEVPTKVGDQKVAFNTALQHAGLLQQSMQALQNGNQQTINSISNRFNNEFGGSGPITAQAIADAYTREISKMLTGGHLTDSEVATVGKTLDPMRQSPQQVLGVLNAYKALAQSKLNMLGNQANAAAGRKTSYTPPSGAPTATGPNGHKIVVDGGKWVDAATGQPIQ